MPYFDVLRSELSSLIECSHPDCHKTRVVVKTKKIKILIRLVFPVFGSPLDATFVMLANIDSYRARLCRCRVLEDDDDDDDDDILIWMGRKKSSLVIALVHFEVAVVVVVAECLEDVLSGGDQLHLN